MLHIRGQFLVGKIDSRLKVSKHPGKPQAPILIEPAEFAFQLAHGLLALRLGFSVDEIGNRFRFRKIEPAIFKRATREFAGLGKPETGYGAKTFRHRVQDGAAAMQMKLDDILAGFVEVGETLEHAVRREVLEEVGIEVEDPRYQGSQPWPFPSQLMCGFFAAYKSGEITIQESELGEADWCRRNGRSAGNTEACLKAVGGQ